MGQSTVPSCPTLEGECAAGVHCWSVVSGESACPREEGKERVSVSAHPNLRLWGSVPKHFCHQLHPQAAEGVGLGCGAASLPSLLQLVIPSLPVCPSPTSPGLA